MKKIIIGGFILLGLAVQSESAQALYSPKISQQVAVIRQHVLQSQAQNGTGDIFEAIQTIKSYNKAKRATFDETGIAGEARVAQDLIRKSYEQTLSNPFDSLMMVFNFNGTTEEWISNCLRDEIWTLERLRDAVGAEMVRAYLLYDSVHGKLLEEDYRYIIGQLDLLRKYGSDPTALLPLVGEEDESSTITSNEYFFGKKTTDPDTINFYTRKYFNSDQTGCPDGEFEKTFESVVSSWDTLKTLSAGGGVEWGSIWSMAKANARIKARQWIKANQLSLSIGGETGANQESIIQGDGWNKFTAQLETNMRILENMIGPVTPLFDKRIWRVHTGAVQDGVKVECVYYNGTEKIFLTCTEEQIAQYKECKKDKAAAEASGIRCSRYVNIEEARSLSGLANKQLISEREHEAKKNEAQTAFVYAINLDSVAEQTIIDVDAIMLQMNGDIQRGYEGVDKKAGLGIPSLTKEVQFLSINQCSNKQ